MGEKRRETRGKEINGNGPCEKKGQKERGIKGQKERRRSKSNVCLLSGRKCMSGTQRRSLSECLSPPGEGQNESLTHITLQSSCAVWLHVSRHQVSQPIMNVQSIRSEGSVPTKQRRAKINKHAHTRRKNVLRDRRKLPMKCKRARLRVCEHGG